MTIIPVVNNDLQHITSVFFHNLHFIHILLYTYRLANSQAYNPIIVVYEYLSLTIGGFGFKKILNKRISTLMLVTA